MGFAIPLKFSEVANPSNSDLSNRATTIFLGADITSAVPVVIVKVVPDILPSNNSILGIITFIESVYSLSSFIALYACIPI